MTVQIVVPDSIIPNVNSTKFLDTRLLWKQSVVLFITETKLFLNSYMSVFETIMLVSSANNIGLAVFFIIHARSIM